MRHHKAMQWEKRLKNVFDEIDNELEATYKGSWQRHPARPAHHTTSNPEADGLFNVGAAFSSGIGSKHGPGYTVEIINHFLDSPRNHQNARLPSIGRKAPHRISRKKTLRIRGSRDDPYSRGSKPRWLNRKTAKKTALLYLRRQHQH